MTVPNLLYVVRVLLIVIYCPRSDVHWMFTQLKRDLCGARGRSGQVNDLEVGDNRVRHAPIRQALDYHPRLQ
jgi:hypothetical protein